MLTLKLATVSASAGFILNKEGLGHRPLVPADNGRRLVFDQHDAMTTMESVAAGAFKESELAAWFHTASSPKPIALGAPPLR